MNQFPPIRPLLAPAFLLVVLACIVVGCARVEPPPGGPEDKTGPVLMGSLPLNGATGVPPDNRIVLYFSEPIREPRRGGAVFISPRPEEPPDIEWKSDHIVINLPDSFQLDRTYLISAGSGITDLRGNPVDSGLTVAFSTGPTIDSGYVAGRVTDQSGRGVEGLHVALYEGGWEQGFDSLHPDYLTQTNKDGRFSLDYLPKGEYRLVAFRDTDRNELFATHAEPYAVPDRPVVVGGVLPLRNLSMTLVPQDSTTPGLVAASTTGDGLIRLRLNRSIPLHTLNAHPGNCRLHLGDGTRTSIPAVTFRERFRDEAKELHFVFREVEDGTYRLSLQYLHGVSALEHDSLVVVWPVDRSRPVIDSLVPAEGAKLSADRVEIGITLSEPIDTTALTSQTFVLTESSDDSTRVGLRLVWRDPLRLELVPDVISPGGDYRLDITEFEIIDAAGNTLGDSLRSRSFSVFSEDDLGWIAGRIKMLLAARKGMTVVLIARNVSTGAEFRLPVKRQEFTIGVPAGRYVLSGFVDSNNNDRRDLGSVDPWMLSETMASHPDTITVRARFETAGVEFTVE